MTKRLLLIVLFSVIIMTLVIGLFLMYNLASFDNKQDNAEVKKTIDLRISPNVNQGVIVEINRIRHRGLLDIIMKPGLQWKQKPTFYYRCTIDEISYNSREVQSANLENDEPFNTWDTMFLENRMMRDVEENVSTSTVTLSLIEEQTRGVLGLQKEDVTKDTLELTYDFRTGRWYGDDNLFDDDGYGHYSGDTFELWFNIYQTDYDHDYIPYFTEVNTLSTNPCESDLNKDPDNDGIPTTWEWFCGYDPNVWDDHEQLDVDIDGLTNIEEYQMRNYFSNPFKQDIYIEVDGMEQGGLLDPAHVLWDESTQIVMERFAEHGINVFFDFGWPDNPKNGGGELLPHYRTISYNLGTFSQFYKHHFPDERKGIFRYVIIAHSSGFATASAFNMLDCFSVDTSKEIMWKSTRRAYTERRQRVIEATTIMHELGHSLGILSFAFEGCDNFTFRPFFTNYSDYKKSWGQYQSVMNYFHIFNYSLVDYSEGSNGPPYDQNDWLEMYLPMFQTELAVFFDSSFVVPGKDKVIIKEFECPLEGWQYNESLTEKFVQDTGNWSPIEPVKCHWKLFVRNESTTYPSEMTVRVYAQPIFQTTIVPLSAWSLIFEGTVLPDFSIELGKLDTLIEQ